MLNRTSETANTSKRPLSSPGFDVEIYTTKEVADQLNDNQHEKVDSFIQAKLLVVYNFSSGPAKPTYNPI